MKTQALLLVADDDPDDQYFLREAIAVVCPLDVETCFALDGTQLMRLLREKINGARRRHLVILDLNMRVKDGRTTLREIKSDPMFAGIPVVILTSSTNAEDLEYCKHYGAVYYLKPHSITELVKIVHILYKDYLN